MQRHDALRQAHARSLVEQVAAARALTPRKAEAVIQAVMLELAWHMQTAMLSRGGLADLVEALGSVDRAAYLKGERLFLDGAARGHGETMLTRLVGTKDASRTLAARAARQSHVDANEIAAMLPHLAVAAIGGRALHCNARLAKVLAQVPPLGRLSRGSPHADLASILRRRCGAGAYCPRALPRAVRRAIAPDATPGARSIVIWYVGFMVGRRAARVLRRIIVHWQGPLVAAGR